MSGRFKRPSGAPHNRADVIKAINTIQSDLAELGGTLLPKLGDDLESELLVLRERVRVVEELLKQAWARLERLEGPWWRRIARRQPPT